MKEPKKKVKKQKLERPKKQYALNQCALYSVRGLGQLAKVLNYKGDPRDLERIADDQYNYRTWLEEGRTIQSPVENVRVIQTRIAVLLRRVQPPYYRHSGVRKRSFLTNAQQHLTDDPSIKIDIRKFYPSTSFRHVCSFFKNDIKCAADVSMILAKLCCYRQVDWEMGHLPTGGVHSEVLGFYCHKRTFDSLLARVETRGGAMSVYVDDIMATMPNASLTDLEWVRRAFKRTGIEIHKGKSRVIPKRSPKIITGVVIANGTTMATADQHRIIKELETALAKTDDLNERRRIARSLLGHYDHIAQIDTRYKSRAVGGRTRLASILK